MQILSIPNFLKFQSTHHTPNLQLQFHSGVPSTKVAFAVATGAMIAAWVFLLMFLALVYMVIELFYYT